MAAVTLHVIQTVISQRTQCVTKIRLPSTRLSLRTAFKNDAPPGEPAIPYFFRISSINLSKVHSLKSGAEKDSSNGKRIIDRHEAPQGNCARV